MDRLIKCYVIGLDRRVLDALPSFIGGSSGLVLIGSWSGVAGFLDGAGGLFGDGLEGFGEVVCLGSSRDLALDAFDLGAVDFLLKPLNEGRFLRAMDKVKRNLDAALPVCVEQALSYFSYIAILKGS